MVLDLRRLFAVVTAADPYRWEWRETAAPRVPGTDALRRRLQRLRSRAAAGQYQRGIGAMADLLETADTTRRFAMPQGLPPLAGRHPIVLAHGPSLAELIPTLMTHRERFYVIAPFRTAMRLADAGIWADVITLADAHFYVSGISVRTWRSTPEHIRERLCAESALLIEPFAPPDIYRDFDRVHIFDDGAGWLRPEAVLPFWGASLLPSLCLPLLLGADRVAIGGIDLGAASGRQVRRWNGDSMRLDPAMAMTLGVFEAVAQAMPGVFVDVSAKAVAKRGFEFRTIAALVAEAVTSEDVPVSHAWCTMRDFIGPVLEAAEGLGTTIAHMSSVGERVCELSASDVLNNELEALVGQMEGDWSTDRACIAALSLAQPPYLRSLWELRAAGVQPRNRSLATRMKARLIGPEIAAVAPAYARCLETLQRSYGHSSPR